MLTTRELTRCALLTALALGLSYLENLFPLSLAIPLPGIRIGFANIVTVFALYALGLWDALLIVIARCTLGSLFAGNWNALVFSLLGGLSALGMMGILSRGKRLSLYGVSIGGAAAHNCGQVAAAVVTLGNGAPLFYLPVLLLTALLTGTVTALVSSGLFRALLGAGLLRVRAGPDANMEFVDTTASHAPQSCEIPEGEPHGQE